ncbi:MAG: esterase family protein [Bacteroidaceae bacterium]|nr:esterase family protein [Bacteroidaceae bacterium]
MRTIKSLSLLLLLPLFISCAALAPKNSYAYRALSIEQIISDEDKPLGTVEELRYHCSVPGPSERRLIVYLPHNYHDSDKRYPVTYMLHGARGHETSWITKGNIISITDSLTSRGLAEESIIVMPNMNQYKNDRDYDNSRMKTALESLLEIDGTVESSFVHDVVELVDSVYRTIPDKEHRAIGGLSVGALQTLFISASSPDIFGYVGLFSPMPRAITKHSAYSNFYKSRNSKIARQFENPPLLYLIMIGKADFFHPHVNNFSKFLNRHDFRHSYIKTSGGHDWYNWKNYYIKLIESVFK